MSAPVRVQLSRKAGWRKPENTAVVARPSKWGNPFKISRVECMWGGFCFTVADHTGIYLDHIDTMAIARQHAVTLYRLHTGPMGSHEFDADTLRTLREQMAGKNLACWCPLNQPCHADVLLELANRGAVELSQARRVRQHSTGP